MGKTFKDSSKRKRNEKSKEFSENSGEKTHSLEPYTGDGDSGKFEAEKNSRGKVTKNSKETAKNANRSLKKSARQKGKKDIEDRLEKFLNDDDEF